MGATRHGVGREREREWFEREGGCGFDHRPPVEGRGEEAEVVTLRPLSRWRGTARRQRLKLLGGYAGGMRERRGGGADGAGGRDSGKLISYIQPNVLNL